MIYVRNNDKVSHFYWASDHTQGSHLVSERLGKSFHFGGVLPGSNFRTSAKYSRSACASSWQFATCGWKSPVTMGGTSWHGWNIGHSPNQRGQHSLKKASFCIASNLRVSNLRVLRTFKQQRTKNDKAISFVQTWIQWIQSVFKLYTCVFSEKNSPNLPVICVNFDLRCKFCTVREELDLRVRYSIG